MADIKVGKYLVKDWTMRKYWQALPTTPLEYYLVRNIGDLSVGIADSNEGYILLASPHSPENGVIKPVTFVLGFYGVSFSSAANFFYYNFKNMYQESDRFFSDIDVAKKFTDNYLERLSKIAVFL